MEIIAAIINIGIDKLSLIGGVLLIMISIFCVKPISVFRIIRLPAIDVTGRSISAIIGIILLLFSFFAFIANAKIGIFSVPPTNGERHNNAAFNFISNAHAVEVNKKFLQQYRPTKVQLPSGDDIILYVGDVHAVSPFKLLIIRPAENIKINETISYSTLISTMDKGDIINEVSVMRGSQISFTYNSRDYTLEITQVRWYLFGPDYVSFTIK